MALDLSLAWRRTKHDFSSRRTFLTHPFVVDLIESDTEGWLRVLHEDVVQGHYNPSACKICPVQKPGGTMRPGSDLAIEDQVVYSALVEAGRSQIQTALEWDEPARDYAYQLRRNAADARWFRNTFALWRKFDQDSLDLLDRGYTHVVVADIAGYYELIDLNTLLSDLNGIGVDTSIIDVLGKCLHRWVRVPRRGIPQGYSPSDVLAKLYLNPVDRSLAGDGIVHRRWVDDFRVFCRAETEARQALMKLCELLGARGLVLQSAKTRIMPASSARNQFRQVQVLLDPIRKEFLDVMVEVGALAGLSVSGDEIDRALAKGARDEPVEILRRAYDRHVVGHALNRTVLHYLLGRLGAAKDGHAIEHALTLLWGEPDETDAVLAYCATVGAVGRAETAWLDLVEHGSTSVYEYQVYQVLKWRTGQSQVPSDRMLRWVRPMAFERARPWYVRAWARRLLGRWGGPEDLERLHQGYPNAESDLERAEIICGLARLERGRRNAFRGHAGGDGPMCSRAARLVREDRVR